MRAESERPAWVVPDALNRRRSAAEPFGQETSRKGIWCNKNIFLGGDGIYTNCYYEPRCVSSLYFLQWPSS